MKVWRVGYISDPLSFVPREFCSWTGRYDDPERQYRTLYCARFQTTALREVLQDFRPNAKARKEFKELFGVELKATIPRDWRRRRVLASATLDIDQGEWMNLESPEFLRELELELAGMMSEVGLEHLDLAEIHGRDRRLSQRTSRYIYNLGASGIRYRSNLPPTGTCWALFEAKAHLEPREPTKLLTRSLPELRKVAEEFGLALD